MALVHGQLCRELCDHAEFLIRWENEACQNVLVGEFMGWESPTWRAHQRLSIHAQSELGVTAQPSGPHRCGRYGMALAAATETKSVGSRGTAVIRGDNGGDEKKTADLTSTTGNRNVRVTRLDLADRASIAALVTA